MAEREKSMKPTASATKYHILTLNQISSHGLHRFPGARYTVGKAVEQPDAILVRSHDMHQMAIPASVKAIGRAGAGTNNIPVAEMSKRGVPVFNAPGANANSVKELVLAGLLLAARNLPAALAYARELPPGLAAVAERNRAKAALLYDYLDGSGFYSNPVARADRSLMNVPFRLRDESLDAQFLKGAEARGMVQLKGHRSVGGMRASIYNAMPIEGVQALVGYLREFEAEHG